MRRICSWCGLTLESGGPLDSLSRHGACADCARKLMKSFGRASSGSIGQLDRSRSVVKGRIAVGKRWRQMDRVSKR